MLEVCVDSIESALAAFEGGCSRLELCSSLSEGGLTPTPGILKVLKEKIIGVPIFCMLRPRGGSDFVYNNDEMNAVLHDLAILKSCGADGFVFGALNENRKINVKQCKDIILKCGDGFPVTFHRAFDFTDQKDIIHNLELIESMGFQRVLTSGLMETAELGLENLMLMSKWARDKKLIILPGAGINKTNLKKVLIHTGCKEFHSSAKTIKGGNSITSKTLSDSKTKNEITYVTDAKIVADLVSILQIL